MQNFGFATLLTTCASLAAFSTGAYADTTGSEQQRIGARLAPNSVEISTTGNVNIDVIPSSTGSLAVGKSTVTVTTTASSGYQLYISAANTDDNGYASLYYDGLKNATSKLIGIPTTSPLRFSSANQWGYAVGTGSPFSGSSDYDTASRAGSIVDSGRIGSLTWRGLDTNMSLINTNTTSGDTDVYFGIYVNTDTMTGSYQNSVIYTAFAEGANRLEIYPKLVKNGDTMTITAEYQSSEFPVTDAANLSVALLDGSASVGACDNINIINNGSTDLLKFSCTVTTNPNFEIGKLYDVTTELRSPGREGFSSFHVDDAWGTVMMSGIAFQDITPAMCRAAQVNETFHVYDNRDMKSYLVTKMADGNCWMTQNLALEGGTTITPANSDVAEDYTLPASSTTGFSDNNAAYMYNGTHVDNTGNTKDIIASAGKSNTGAYYSWLAAIAATDGTNADDNYTADEKTALKTTGSQATYSICPRGWKLPLRDNGMIKLKNMYDLTDFRLYWNQGVAGDSPLVGHYYDNSFNYSGSFTAWWSREVHSAPHGLGMYQDDSGFNTGYYAKRTSFSVRCVLDTSKTFQNFTQTDADALAEDETTTLLDTRDNKSYLVTKLRDGSVWMTQNLALAGGKTITPENSDVKANYTLPPSGTQGFDLPTSQDMNNGSHKDGSANTINGNTGAYYSWLTAVAANDGNYNSTETAALNTSGTQAAYSICPKNWRLPLRNDGLIALKTIYGNDQLKAIWNQGVTGADYLIGIYQVNQLSGDKRYADYWSREVGDAERALYMGQNSGEFTSNSFSKGSGRSVRCIFSPQPTKLNSTL